MLKIYYDRFRETCHNIFKSLIFFLPSFFSFSSPFSPKLRSIISFSKQSFVHRSHAIRSPSTRRPRVIWTLRTLSARRSHCLCTVRELSARPPRTVRELPARPPHTVHELPARPSHTVHELCARPPHTIHELSARPPHTVRELSARPPRIVRHSPSLCCSFSQNQIKKGSK